MCVIKFKLAINFCRDLNKDGILFSRFHASWILSVNLISIMINSVDNITNKCRVICRHCFCARGLFFSRTVALVTRHAHLGGCLPETHLPVLVMIISVPSSWNLSHKSLVSRRHSTPASSRLHAGDVVVETSSLSASTSVTPSTFTLLGLASEWSSTNFSENREMFVRKVYSFLKLQKHTEILYVIDTLQLSLSFLIFTIFSNLQ